MPGLVFSVGGRGRVVIDDGGAVVSRSRANRDLPPQSISSRERRHGPQRLSRSRHLSPSRLRFRARTQQQRARAATPSAVGRHVRRGGRLGPRLGRRRVQTGGVPSMQCHATKNVPFGCRLGRRRARPGGMTTGASLEQRRTFCFQRLSNVLLPTPFERSSFQRILNESKGTERNVP